jgi:hypothetical protein
LQRGNSKKGFATGKTREEGKSTLTRLFTMRTAENKGNRRRQGETRCKLPLSCPDDDRSRLTRNPREKDPCKHRENHVSPTANASLKRDPKGREIENARARNRNRTEKGSSIVHISLAPNLK